MEYGKYGAGNTKFDKLIVSKFPNFSFDFVKYGAVGCGATALAFITGESPFKIAQKVKNKHYSDRFMLDFLRQHGISCFKVNRANLTNSPNQLIEHKLQDNHVILYSKLISKKECSWFVSWNRYEWHNFRVTAANYYDLLNFPIESCYVLFKKEWK